VLARLKAYPRKKSPDFAFCANPAALIITSANTIAIRLGKVLSFQAFESSD
jgi:hypothetical protein